MHHLFVFVSTLTAEGANTVFNFKQQLLSNQDKRVYQLHQTKSAHLLFGSFFVHGDCDVSPLNINTFYENEDADSVFFNGDINESSLHGLKQSDTRTLAVQFASFLVQKISKNGGNFIATLSGKLLYIGFDSVNKTLHVGKDPFNTQSLYWTSVNGGTLISTDLSFLSAMVQKPLKLSEKGLASWLSGFPNPAISLFDDVQILPSGSRLAISENLDEQVVQFWDIDPDHKILMPDTQHYAEHFQGLLRDSVAQACRSNQNTLVSQMSGGLDSTSITTLAKEVLAAQEKRVLPLSHIYSRADSCDESELIADMLEYLNVSGAIQIEVDGEGERDFLALYPTSLSSPGTVLSPRYRSELAKVRSSGADVLLSGNGGDEMCWGHSVAYTQRLKEGDVSVIPEVLAACGLIGMSRKSAIKNLFIKPFIPDILLRLFGHKPLKQENEPFPAWLTVKAKTMAKYETKIVNPFSEKADPVGFNRYQSLKTTATFNAVNSYQQLSYRYGVEVRHPFFNKELAEFTFAVPAKQLIQGPYPKWLLRNSMSDKLPKRICWNIKKITFDQHFGNLVRENAEAIRHLFNHPTLVNLGLIDLGKLLEEFDRVVNDVTYPLHVDLLYAILTFSWLNTHFPE